MARSEQEMSFDCNKRTIIDTIDCSIYVTDKTTIPWPNKHANSVADPLTNPCSHNPTDSIAYKSTSTIPNIFADLFADSIADSLTNPCAHNLTDEITNSVSHTGAILPPHTNTKYCSFF